MQAIHYCMTFVNCVKERKTGLYFPTISLWYGEKLQNTNALSDFILCNNEGLCTRWYQKDWCVLPEIKFSLLFHMLIFDMIITTAISITTITDVSWKVIVSESILI